MGFLKFLVIIGHASWHSFLIGIWEASPIFLFCGLETTNIDLTRYPRPDQIERSYVIDHVVLVDLLVHSYHVSRPTRMISMTRLSSWCSDTSALTANVVRTGVTIRGAMHIPDLSFVGVHV